MNAGTAKAGTINKRVHPAEHVPSRSKKMRVEMLRKLLPSGAAALEIGARDGYISMLLREYFRHVTALDLEKLPWDLERIRFVAGDVRRMQFPDDTFDCVVCTEVLEHIDELEQAAAELERVVKPGGHILVSVPYKQDLRVGRTYCHSCGRSNPPYGHLHSFDEGRLTGLFRRSQAERIEFDGSTREATTRLSAWLMNAGRHPWGTYSQEEPCIYCGGPIRRPENRPLAQVLASSMAGRLDRVAMALRKPYPLWVYTLLRKVR